MALAYFCIFENTARTTTRVEIRAVQPEPVIEAPGWIPRYVAILDNDASIEGAGIVLARMDVTFPRHRIARGMFGVLYTEIRQWVKDQLALANAPPAPVPPRWQDSAAHHLSVAIRVIAGMFAVLLFCAYVVANVWGTFYCLFIPALRRRSLLYDVAETTLIFKMLDWRKAIQALAGIALSR
jgi:hypothetical protein